MKKGTVLSVDDDENLQTVISHYLESDGYQVITASSGSAAIQKVEENSIDCILLDLILPDEEGMTLIPQFKNKSEAGIIVVSGKSDTTEKIICLEMGADDYLTKPFEMRELSARIKAVQRRMAPSNDKKQESSAEKNEKDSNKESIEFGDWVLDRGQYQVFDKNKKPMDFTTGEFQLLEALVMAPNRALSREHLFELTRDGKFDVYDRAIDIQVARIRKKLGDENSTIIKTVRGIGYMFSSQN